MQKDFWKNNWQLLLGSYTGGIVLYFLMFNYFGGHILGDIFFWPARLVMTPIFMLGLPLYQLQPVVLVLFWGTVIFYITKKFKEKKKNQII